MAVALFEGKALTRSTYSYEYVAEGGVIETQTVKFATLSKRAWLLANSPSISYSQHLGGNIIVAWVFPDLKGVAQRFKLWPLKSVDKVCYNVSNQSKRGLRKEAFPFH